MTTRITDTETSDILNWTRDIAAALGKSWFVSKGTWDDNRDAYLHGTGGERIHVRPGTRYSNRNRIEITGSLDHEFSRHDEPQHLITVSPGKDPVKVAADITRRLLPSYREGLVHAATRKRRHEEAQALRARKVRDLAGILPGARSASHDPDTVEFGGGKFRLQDGVPIGGTAKVLYGGDVEWDIRTGAQLSTLALAELIAKVARDAH